MERRVPTWFGYPEGKYGHCTNIGISRLGEDIPCTFRCINDSTWIYLSATRSRKLGSPDISRKQKIIRLGIEYNTTKREGIAMVYAL
jgi:hypothetical protein